LLLNKQIEETINNTIYVDGHEFYDLKETIPAIKSLISQAVQEALLKRENELAKVILIDIANDERNIFSPEKTVWDIKKRCEELMIRNKEEK